MSLKRKASFSAALPSSPLTPVNEWPAAVDTTKHLHSRTRKRFRNDRPNDALVYQNTLRWIFSAQQQRANPMPTPDPEAMDSEPSPSTPSDAIDPRQKTLLQFFRPNPQPASPFRPSRQALAARANECALATEDDLVRRQAFERLHSVASSSGNESNSPEFMGQADADVEMDMDGGSSSSDGSGQTPMTMTCAGGAGWM
ncbi:hypothetical protein N7510_011519 [Penicillium lagena]|uniref:uncharacterized protein n=1 Tax=Penicillium lagena TaxID=94218 RepID=UPI0025423DD2|nr:uncharacterized protein N7510_011519 [Penicillium lagena]KAJ5601985.1 hypothetical protein N7510_011519 [Penicillium lagena]